MENLHAMLNKYLPLEAPGDHDVEAIRRLDGFESDDRPLVAVLFEEFRDNGKNDVEKLVAAGLGKKWDELRYLAHSLKSSGRTLGLARFGDLCEQLEREGDGTKDLDAEVVEVRALYQRGCAWLEREVGGAPETVRT